MSVVDRAGVRRPDWRRYQDRLAAVEDAAQNFALEEGHEATEADGWRLDHHTTELPAEPPGPPRPPGAPDASWAIARELVRTYAFPDPRLITGIYAPDRPVSGRPMLLRARFLGFTFWFGVRMSDEVEEVRETDDGPVHVYSTGYSTLEGHFERGQITFEVRKTERTGAVAFHMDAFSQPDHIRNPFYRIGFKLFGRRLQLRFARTAIERMQRFVGEELAARAAGVEAPERETVEPQRPDAEAAAHAADTLGEG